MIQSKSLAIIVVTHNSDDYLKYCLHSIKECGIFYKQLIIIDSGSTEKSYLEKVKEEYNYSIVKYEDNIGFSNANNIGYQLVDQNIKFVLFLNPDIYFSNNIITDLIVYLTNEDKIFAITPKLMRFYFKDINSIVLTKEIDTSGIKSTFYGRYFDNKVNLQEDIINAEAICGAFMLCKREKLDQIYHKYGMIFNKRMFMYKEDIELCLRARKEGMKLVVANKLVAYHGRGWKKRKDVQFWQRKISIRNEFFLLEYFLPPKKILASMYFSIKYLYINYFERFFIR